jgi:hypothetical protein
MHQEPSPTEIDHLLSILGEQYENLLKIAKETFRSLGQEQAGYFTNLSNDWLDILSVIHDTYPMDEFINSLVYIYFSALFKEVYWFQLLFLGGNYPLLHRSIRFVWEMIFRAYHVDTYKRESSNDPEPPGPTIDNKVEWLGKYERKKEMYKWSFVQRVLQQLLTRTKSTEIEKYYESLWHKLNEYVHPSKALLDRMAIGAPGSLMTDIFDEKWALETIETAIMIFDLVWLAVLTRFPNCTEVLAQKGLHLDYPLITAALENFSSTE